MTKKEILEEFTRYIYPKKFCGGVKCTGLRNLECDDIKHADGRQLVPLSKCILFISKTLDDLESSVLEAVVEKMPCTADNCEKEESWNQVREETIKRINVNKLIKLEAEFDLTVMPNKITIKSIDGDYWNEFEYWLKVTGAMAYRAMKYREWDEEKMGQCIKKYIMECLKNYEIESF